MLLPFEHVSDAYSQRSNYSEANVASLSDDEGGESSGIKHGRARQTISDKRTNLVIPGTSPAARKKKSTMNIRTALLYKKNFATLIDESVSLMTYASTGVSLIVVHLSESFRV